MVIELTGWRSPEVGADELGDAAFGVGQQQVGGVGGGEASGGFGVAQDLADFGFQAVEKLAYAGSQAGGFALQDVAAEQAHETGVALREGQHQGEDLAALARLRPCVCSAMRWMRGNRLSSTNSIRASSIFALLGKCR